MEKIYKNLTQYEKKHKWTARFGSLFRLYFSKLWSTLVKDKKTWIFNSLMLLPVLAGPIVALISWIQSDSIYPLSFFSWCSDIIFMGYFGIIIPLFTMYIASMMFSEEIGDRSITYLTSRPIHRLELVVVKYLCYICIVPLITGIAVLLCYVSFGVFGRFQYFDMGIWYFLIALLASAVYGAVFMLIGLLFKNPLWFGLSFAFIWEFVIASFSQTLNKMTIGYYIKSLIVYPIFGSTSPAIFTGTNNQAYQFATFNIVANATTFSVIMVVIVIVSISLSWAVLQGDKLRVPYQAGRRPGGWKYYLKEIRSYLITFGIILMTVGVVFGPVNGVRKQVAYTHTGDITISEYSDWYFMQSMNPGDDISPPNLGDMGFGYLTEYQLTTGDNLDITFYVSGYIDSSNYLLVGAIVTKEAYTEFYGDAQDLWVQWVEFSQPFSVLVANYFALADDFLDETVDYAYYSQSIPNSVSIEATDRTNYVFISLVVDYETIASTEFRARNLGMAVEGEIFRRVGYAFGYVLSGFGVCLIGLAIFSIVTYDSSVELKRYEEKIAIYNDTTTTSETPEEAQPIQEVEAETVKE